MLGASVLLVPFVYFSRDITRVWGIALSLAYACYVAIVLL
jgi:cation:H+ antiporter